MPFTIDHLVRHIAAGQSVAGTNIAEQRLRDAAFQLARRRFLGEIDNSAIARAAGLAGDNA